MNLSFAGCGFLGIYHVGVAVCFRKYAPHLLLNKISGASAGAIAACCLLCDLPLGDLTSDVLRVACEARSKSLGPFHPSFNIQNILLEGMEKVLPEDAHLRVNGKLHISLTRVYDGKNVIVSHFDSREDLMQALLASAFIPIFSGILPPKFKGVRYMDGGMSDNLPTLDENTITVSPFCGESDICPRDDSMQLFHINVANTSIELSKHNIYRIARILFPPKPEILSNMCKQGFDDALRFLHRNNLINCTRCLAVQSTFVVSESLEESYEYDPQCLECKIHRQEALVSNLPDTVLTIFQDAIDTANKGIVNWMFKHQGIKCLSVLSIPYTLPADMVYATFTKIMQMAPMLGENVWKLSKYFMDQLQALLNKVSRKKRQVNSNITCQFALTEYGGNDFDVEAGHTHDHSSNRMNLNFVLNLDNNDLPANQSPGRKFSVNKILSRRPSSTFNKTDGAIGEDNFDNILQVTAQHDAIMAYYYLDENNKVKVTEIFDVTDSDIQGFQSTVERENNLRLEFDDEWDETTWNDQGETSGGRRQSITEMSEYSLEDILDRDTSNIFSDPESEWTGTFKVEEPEDDQSDDQDDLDDLLPESDHLYKNPSSYQIPSFTFDS